MNEFILGHDPKKPDGQYVIRTGFPAIVFNVVRFKDEDKLSDYVAKNKANDTFFCTHVPGYNILLTVPVHILQKVHHTNLIFELAAEYFLEQVIKQNERVYRYNKIKE